MISKKDPLNIKDQEQIQKAVEHAESLTNAEIAIVMATSSTPAAWVHAFWAILGWIFASMILWIQYLQAPSWNQGLVEILFWQTLGMAIGNGLAFLPWLKRKTLSQKIVAASLRREALAQFLLQGLAETRQHNGVLIYLSDMERAIEVIADKEAYLRMSESYWKKLVTDLCTVWRSSKGMEGVCARIEKLGEELSQVFPKTADDKNELTNEVLKRR